MFKTCLAVSLCNGSISSRRVSLKDNGYSVMAGAGVDPIVSPWSRLLTNNEYRAGGPNLINLMEPQSLPYQSRSCTRSTKLHFSDLKLVFLKSGIIGCNEYDHMSKEYKKYSGTLCPQIFSRFFQALLMMHRVVAKMCKMSTKLKVSFCNGFTNHDICIGLVSSQ